MIGKKELNAGYIYVPYVIEQKTPIIIEGSFTPKKIIRSRYSEANITGYYEYNSTSLKKNEEDYNRVYSEIDPYGEEDWTN